MTDATPLHATGWLPTMPPKSSRHVETVTVVCTVLQVTPLMRRLHAADAMAVTMFV